MESAKELYKILENKILNLLKENKEIKGQVIDLEREIVFLKEKLSEQRIHNEELKDKNEVLKIASAVGGNKEHRRLMKNKVNGLVKEIDRCIKLIDYTDR
ncbi:hypothetical protein UJ101_01860 [Flavobacteriaceae bacterium UJ101]|nr:hypothetical protein UJ101_01860 [Flavobacteriaceae bacterium UJ101]